MSRRNRLMMELRDIMEDEVKVFSNILPSKEVDSEVINEETSSEDVIMALKKTDYRDQSAYFKMVELLKGLAVASKEDEKAAKYLSRVSDALTKVADMVLGDEEDEDGEED